MKIVQEYFRVSSVGVLTLITPFTLHDTICHIKEGAQTEGV
jgi:hypothetical protein